MNNRDILLNLLEGKTNNKILWAPRIKLWYDYHKRQGTLPQEYRGLNLKEVEKTLGAAAGSSARIDFRSRKWAKEGHFVKPKFKTVEVETKVIEN